MTADGSSRVHWVMETLAIVGVVALSLFLVVRLVLDAGAGHWWLVAVAAPIGYAAADVLSGLVHWIFDTWGSEETPVVGRGFIGPFREHHRDPASITRHDFIETNGNNSMAVLPLLAGACLIPTTSQAGIFALAFVLFTSLGILATNQFHKWAHQERPPRIVRRLQELWLILPRDHHLTHHAPPYATHYCITTGWMNAVLAAVGFHRSSQRAVDAARRGGVSG